MTDQEKLLSSKIEDLQRELLEKANKLSHQLWPGTDLAKGEVIGEAVTLRKCAERLTPLLELAKEMERSVARAKPDNYGDPLVK